MTACEARSGEYLTLHTCGDPLACALEHLGPPPVDEADRLHELLDRVEELCEASKSKVARDVLAAIHAERGGPR